MSLQQRAGSGVKWTGTASAVTGGLRLLQLFVLARLLLPDDFGLMGMVLIAIGFVEAFSDLGISAALIHRQDLTKQQFSSCYWLNVGVGVVICGLMLLAAPLVAAAFQDPRLTDLLQIAALVFLIIPVGKPLEMMLQKELAFGRLAAAEIVGVVAGTLCAIWLAVGGFGVWALVLGLVTQMSCKAALLVATAWSTFRPQWHFSWEDLTGFASFGLFQMGERAVNFLSERIDHLVLGLLLGSHALGLYAFAASLVAQPVSRINPIATRVAFPVFARLQRDRRALQDGYCRLVRMLTTINAPLLLGMAAVAPVAVPGFFGAHWAESVLIVQLLALVALLRSVGNPIGSLQLALGRADLGFYWNVLLLLVTVPSLYMSARLGGATGVALALVLLQLALQPVVYRFLLQPLVGSVARPYVESILRPVVLSLGMAAAAFLITLYAPTGDLFTVALATVTGGAIYVVLLYLFDRSTLETMRSMLRRSRSPAATGGLAATKPVLNG